MKDLIDKTVWLVRGSTGYVARDSNGVAVATHRYKSTLEYMMRQKLPGGWAIASVILQRQPNRALRRRKEKSNG
jgi:hypothetical protein